MFFYYPGYWLLAGVLFLIGFIVSGRLKSKFKEYSGIPLAAGLSGKEVAEKIGEALLAKMNELDMKSAKAKSGARVDTVKNLSTKVEDREAWMTFVFERGDDSFITNHVAKEAIEQYMDDHEGEAPPGIKVESMLSLRFTKAK